MLHVYIVIRKKYQHISVNYTTDCGRKTDDFKIHFARYHCNREDCNYRHTFVI